MVEPGFYCGQSNFHCFSPHLTLLALRSQLLAAGSHVAQESAGLLQRQAGGPGQLKRTMCLTADPMQGHTHPGWAHGPQPASRCALRTGFPAANWVFHRLRKGGCLWVDVHVNSSRDSRKTRPKVGKERFFLLPTRLRNVSSAQDCGLRRGAGRKEPWSQRKLDPGSATSELCAEVSYLTSLGLTSTIHHQPAAGRATEEVCKAYMCSRNIASFFP